MSFHILQSGKKIWIFQTSDLYYAGTDFEAVTHIVEKLNLANRPNVRQGEDGLYICWGEHFMNEPCVYQKELYYSAEDGSRQNPE